MGFKSRLQQKAVMAILKKLGKRLGAKKGDMVLFNVAHAKDTTRIAKSGFKPGKIFGELEGTKSPGVFLAPHGRDLREAFAYKMTSSNEPLQAWAVRAKGSDVRKATRAFYRRLAKAYPESYPSKTIKKSTQALLKNRRAMRQFIVPSTKIKRATTIDSERKLRKLLGL